MDKRKVAGELVKLAKEVVAADRLADFDDDGDLADELDDELSKILDGSSDVNKNEIIFYEEATRAGV